MIVNLFRLILLTLCSAIMLASCHDVGSVMAYDATFVYSGNLNGELEPCGCAEETDFGGILRRATMVDKLRADNPAMFLISSGGLFTNNTPQDRIKAKYIISGMSRMNYDAVGLQWTDLAFGNEFISESENLPWISSNYQHEKIKPMVSITRGNYSYDIYSWMTKKSRILKTNALVQSKADIESLNQSLRKSKENGKITILMSTLTYAVAKKLFELKFVDILLVNATDEQFNEPELIGGVLVLQPGNRGMKLGRISIQFGKQGRISSFKQDIISLSREVKDFPGLSKWYKDFNDETKRGYLSRVKLANKLNKDESSYLGAKRCKSCHSKAYDKWRTSSHNNAFEALEAVNKSYDPDCVGCHTVGFGKEGGFIDPISTMNLIGVQCESCHGASKGHVESAGALPTKNVRWENNQVCAQCHIGSHSPQFNFEKYWVKIKH